MGASGSGKSTLLHILGSVDKPTEGKVMIGEFGILSSVGATPRQIRTCLLQEAFIIAGKPVLVTVPLVAAAVAALVKMSYLEPMDFVREIPFAPMFVFVLAVFGFVGPAYYLGAKKVLGSDLADAPRDDTMM